jgi:hypothetical protein
VAKEEFVDTCLVVWTRVGVLRLHQLSLKAASLISKLWTRFARPSLVMEHLSSASGVRMLGRMVRHGNGGFSSAGVQDFDEIVEGATSYTRHTKKFG